MLISYGKGARSWERHIDIEYENVPVSNYCTLPHQADEWFKAFHKAAEMCGGSPDSRRVISKREIEYLDALVRGAYARKQLDPGYVLTKENFEKDFYLAIPLLKGQLSCREVMNGEKLTKAIAPNEALTIDHIDGPYASNAALKQLILNRGV
jgi:N-acetylneuraminate synthase